MPVLLLFKPARAYVSDYPNSKQRPLSPHKHANCPSQRIPRLV